MLSHRGLSGAFAALNQRGRTNRVVMDDPDRLARLAEYVSLVYHEARNVRHLIRAGAVKPEKWKYLIALPTNREEA